MDTTMIQLRLFVHQRLFSAAEDILGEVEKTIALALHEADVSGSKEEAASLRHHFTKQPAARSPVTTSNMAVREERGLQLLQESLVPSTPEESPEDPGPSNPSTDPDATDWSHCLVGTDIKVPEVKEEQEQQAGDEGPTPEAVFPFPEIGTFEQNRPEISYEIQPESSSVKDQKERYFCPFCNKDFFHMGALVIHANSHKRQNKCKSCGKTYKSTQKLIKHFKGCCSKNLFCDICGKLFSTIYSVLIHKRKLHTGVGEFSCQKCGKTFNRRDKYASHMRTHSEQTPYHCDICGQAFSQGQDLIVHKRIHSEEKPYQHTNHGPTRMMVHGEERGLQLLQENLVPSTPEGSPEDPGPSDPSTDLDETDWNHCLVGTEFKMPEIKEEQEQAGDEGPTPEAVFLFPEIGKFEQDQPEISYEIQLESSVCSAAGSDNDGELVNSIGEQMTMQEAKNDKAALSRRNPSGKDFKDHSFCPFCGKGFLYIGSLTKHVKTHKRQNDCNNCGQTYQSPKALIKHLKSCHSKSLFCDICCKVFSDRGHFRRHKKTHKGVEEFVCQECGKTFQRVDHLNVHVRIHSGEKPYQCDICEKAFSQSQNLIIHKRIHTGEKPYECGLCDKGFTTSSQLKTHVMVHSGERPHPCDICGKLFPQRGKMRRHRIIHTKGCTPAIFVV